MGLSKEELLHAEIILKKDNLVIFDVGVNEGEHIDLFLSRKNVFSLHCFEPNIDKYKQLITKHSSRKNIFISQYGLSNVAGEVDFYKINGFKCFHGLSTCFYRKDVFPKVTVEKTRIKCITLDEYCKENNISKIDFLKIDTEGSEFNILKGSENFLRNKSIEYIQFEYGLCWADAQTTMEECLNYLHSFGYRVYESKDGKFNEVTEEKKNYNIKNMYNYLATYLEMQ